MSILPKDPHMLLSVINMKLRDFYSSLDVLAIDMDASIQDIKQTLESIDYYYNEKTNQFIAMKPKYNILLSDYSLDNDAHYAHLKSIITKEQRVCILALTFDDTWLKKPSLWEEHYSKGGKYYLPIIKQFTRYGIDEQAIKWVHYFKDNHNVIKDKIARSDVIFITGGLPNKAVKRIKALKLNALFKDEHIIIGASAGALIQLNEYFLTPDESNASFCYQKGIQLIKKDFFIDVHYQQTSIQQECIQRVIKEKKKPLYAIKDGGIMIVKNDIIHHTEGTIHFD